MGYERMNRAMRRRCRMCISGLLCLALLGGCSRKTENIAVQDRILDMQETALDAQKDVSDAEKIAEAASAVPESVPDTENTASAEGKPALDTEAAASAEGKPAADTEATASAAGKPAVDTEAIASAAGKPAVDTEATALAAGKPAVDTEATASAEGKPAADTEATASAAGEPALDAEPGEDPDRTERTDGQNEGTEEERTGTQQHSHSFAVSEITKQPDCVEQGSKKEICTICGAVRETAVEALGHNMTTQWYGDPPDCTHGGYRAVLCSRCGWVDEESCGNVPALEHIPVAEEIQHGNCREDTIIIYTCSRCKEQTGYDRHTEPDEHKWVWKNMQIWDEEACEFVTIQIECCERCNVQP